MFPEDKHLETYLIPNKKPESSPPVANVIIKAIKVVFSITIPIAISFTLLEKILDVNPTFEINSPIVNTSPNYIPTRPSEEQLPENSFPSDLPVSTGPAGPADTPDELNRSDKISPDSVSTTYIDGHWIHIPSSCNSFRAGGANFRVSPSLDASVIKGVVLVGDRVFLTGETAYGDGIIWHRALNEGPLERSIEHGALNILVADQEGWIANCFVD